MLMTSTAGTLRQRSYGLMAEAFLPMTRSQGVDPTRGVPTAVVSMPCALIFNQQDAGYQHAVLGETLARVAVEAAVQMSWDRYLGLQGCFVGMHGFGESGKIADVYKKFDINTDAIVRAARDSLKSVYGT